MLYKKYIRCQINSLAPCSAEQSVGERGYVSEGLWFRGISGMSELFQMACSHESQWNEADIASTEYRQSMDGRGNQENGVGILFKLKERAYN